MLGWCRLLGNVLDSLSLRATPASEGPGAFCHVIVVECNLGKILYKRIFPGGGALTVAKKVAIETTKRK